MKGRTYDDFSAEIAVPNSAAGAIIGKGGVTINEIRGKTGARLHVSPKEATVCGCLPGSGVTARDRREACEHSSGACIPVYTMWEKMRMGIIMRCVAETEVDQPERL